VLEDESVACSMRVMCAEGGVVESLMGGLWTISLHHLAKLLKCRVAICMETWTQAEDVGLIFVPCLIRHAWISHLFKPWTYAELTSSYAKRDIT
jgi:flagellar biosynthesis protein FliQ